MNIKIKTNSKTINPIKEIQILKEIASHNSIMKTIFNPHFCQIQACLGNGEYITIKLNDNNIEVWASNGTLEDMAYSVPITEELDIGKILKFLEWT